MKNAQIRIIFILASLCTIGIIISQIYGLRRAYTQENERFNQNVTVSLRDVAFKVWELKQSQSTIYNVVNRISDDNYVLKINENVDESILEHFLKETFSNNGVYADFTFGLHDCLYNSFKYEKFVNMSNKNKTPKDLSNFPPTKIDNYYVAIHFPYRDNYLSAQLTIWVVSSLIILATLAFLSYVIYVILNQKRLSEMQKDFVKNMTHEFKTPLTSIQLAASVLRRPNIKDNPTKLFNYATIIDVEAKKLELQVERVLQMSMGQKKELNLNKKLFDIRTTLQDVVQNHATHLETRNGVANMNMSNNPVMIYGDEEHLRSAFNNLMDNAIKYTPEEKSPVIDITIKDIYKTEIHIIFKDNGMGIAKQSQKLIYERFYRVSTGNIHNIKGFGIGLNYVKSIIKMHNGQIECESNLGKGTSFTIILPKPTSN